MLPFAVLLLQVAVAIALWSFHPLIDFTHVRVLVATACGSFNAAIMLCERWASAPLRIGEGACYASAAAVATATIPMLG